MPPAPQTPDARAEREIFAAVAALPVEERAAYLDAVCETQPELRRRVEAWLAEHESNAFMQTVAGGNHVSAEQAGERIGNYKLIEKIGEGGFGTVWVAEQERPVRRRVALKIIKLGMDTREVVARFEQERQALAMMDHPNIAKVLDAGATESGRPFFVMELVRGVKITDYCDEATLPTSGRLALFIQVCHAVQHAHQKGIIHRDLKPSNILVTMHDGAPVPKVIDFGVAKATQQQRLSDLTVYTQFQQMIGTPLYMSPEQADMSGLDIDTRSDIYSLGVLLYELLTGRTPFDPRVLMKAGLDEMRRVIREQEPRKPSTVLQTMTADDRTSVARHRQAEETKMAGLVRGDLDWIVMKALEKDRARRYETANGFANDIQRHLDNEPVLARPPSRLYRFHRTVQRNKMVFAAGGGVALALLLAVVVLTASRARITRETNQKDTALADAKDQLFLALLNRARAERYSRQPGQRLDSLDALAKAAGLGPREELRDEAIAAMALPDVHPGPGWSNDWPQYVDGECRLSVTWDAESIILHSVPDGREVRRIKTGRPARDMTLSRDGRFVAEQDTGFKLRIWRVSDGQTVFGDEPGRCDCWVFSADSRHLAVGTGDEIVRYDLEMGREINRWRARGPVHALAFHPEGNQLAIGYKSTKFVSTCAVADGAQVAEVPVGTMNEHALAWHPDGRRLAIGGSDPRIQIWDVPAKRKLATLEGHAQQVTVLDFHPGGSLLVSISWDAIHRMWEPSSGRQVLQFSHPLSSFEFSRNGRWLGVIAAGGGGQLLEVAPCPEYRTFASRLGAVQGAFFDGGISPDGRLLAMGMKEGVTIWELASGREAAFLPIRRTQSAFFQPGGRELITCGDTGLQRWSIPECTDSAQPLQLGSPQKITLPFSIPTRACRSRDGRLIAVTSEEGSVAVVLDATTGVVQPPLFKHTRAGFVALSPDGKCLATAGWQSEKLRLWNVQTGELAYTWERPTPLSIAFTPDSRELVWMRMEECGFWSVETYQQVRRLPRNASLYSTPAAFSPEEKLVAVEATPGVIHLTELATGRLVAKLTDPFGDRATWMNFTPDGTQLVTVSQYAKTIHVWDLRLIRAQLKKMDLDWAWPEFPP